MAEGTIKVILDPDTRKLDRALKGTKIGVGGRDGPSQKKQEKNSGLMVGLTGKLLKTIIGIAAILSALDFVIRPLAAILTAVMALFFLPLVPIVSKIVAFFTKTAKAITRAPQFKITGEEGIIETVLKSLANVALRIGAFFIAIGMEIGKWILDKIIFPIGNFITGIIIKIGDSITGVILEGIDIIKKGFEFLLDIGFRIWEEILKPGFLFLEDVGQKAWNIMKSGFDFVKKALKKVANFIIDLINRIPFVDIPRIAAGGIVTRPTLAVVGEKGPEAIIPLNKAGGFGGGDITININNPSIRNDQDIKKLTSEISRIMAGQLKRGFS